MKSQHTEKVKAAQPTMIIYKIHEAFDFQYIIFLWEIAKSAANDKKWIHNYWNEIGKKFRLNTLQIRNNSLRLFSRAALEL